MQIQKVEITATTIDINGDVEISGTTTQTGISTSASKDVFNVGLSVKNGSTSAGFIEFFEDSDNGTNKVTLIGLCVKWRCNTNITSSDRYSCSCRWRYYCTCDCSWIVYINK